MEMKPRTTHAIGIPIGLYIIVATYWIVSTPTDGSATPVAGWWFGVIAGVFVVLLVLDARSAWTAWKAERRAAREAEAPR